MTDKALPAYGHISFAELGRDVNDAIIGRRDEFDFGTYSFPGHAPTAPMNFNSLNRIVSKYASAASPPPVTMEEIVEVMATFANFADVVCANDGWSESDSIGLCFENTLLDRIEVADFRRARSLLSRLTEKDAAARARGGE